MNAEPWIQNLSVRDMPTEDAKIVAEFLGVTVALEMMRQLPGIVINIPEHGLKKIRNKYIIEKYDGTRKTKMILAIECNVTEGYIRKLISREKMKNVKKSEL